jgi:UrcA family protein
MKTIAIAAVVAASLFSAPALAQNGHASAPTRIVISPAGLDLATAEGRAALDLRILHAARTACGTPSSADAQGRSKTEACVADLRSAAAEQRDIMIASAERRARTSLASR